MDQVAAMPQYRSNKVVSGFKIARVTVQHNQPRCRILWSEQGSDSVTVDEDFASMYTPQPGMYYVIDEYSKEACVHAHAFEAGYSKIE